MIVLEGLVNISLHFPYSYLFSSAQFSGVNFIESGLQPLALVFKMFL